MADDELRFLNANAAPPKVPTAWSNLVEVWREVWTLLAIFVGVTMSSAALLYFGTPHGWGIQPTFSTGNEAEGAVTFFDCLHFSIVTIATLGYGDFRPESYGRLIAGAEVVTGIVLMGVFISRLVSRQQERMTRRLVRGQINAEIQDFRDQLANLLKSFNAKIPVLELEQSSADLYRAGGLATSIARYWRHEAKNLKLADVLPSRAAGRLLGELIELLEVVANSSQGKSKSDLHVEDINAIRRITESTLTVSNVLLTRVPDDGIRHSNKRISVLVGNLRQQLQLH